MKPRIDFYKLAGDNRTAVNRFCCQLADKVVRMGHSVFILTRDARETQLLDDMLWTYSDSSFLPHARQGDDDLDVPVVIGHAATETKGYLLVNMGDERPANLGHFERVAEIINDTPDVLHKGRARYSAYKKEDYALHYHEIAS